jgi:uridine phosphorylase
LRKFYDPSPPLLTPRGLVSALTGSKPEDLLLPDRAIITFNLKDLKDVVSKAGGGLVEGWLPFKQIHRIAGRNTVIVKSEIGGPHIAALIEELSAFGVKEFIIWGYCGAIDRNLRIGDIIVSSGALREDGVSYHYSTDDEDFIHTDWLGEWREPAKKHGFAEGVIWSCDAIYRETQAKVARFREMGIKAVEMEVASVYSVCQFLGLKAIAFLVVSDLFTEDTWQGGFRTKNFKEGVRRLSRFILEQGVR